MRAMVVMAVIGLLAGGPAWAALTPEQTKQAEALIGQFGSVEFKARQEAVEKLAGMGKGVSCRLA